MAFTRTRINSFKQQQLSFFPHSTHSHGNPPDQKCPPRRPPIDRTGGRFRSSSLLVCSASASGIGEHAVAPRPRPPSQGYSYLSERHPTSSHPSPLKGTMPDRAFGMRMDLSLRPTFSCLTAVVPAVWIVINTSPLTTIIHNNSRGRHSTCPLL